MRHLTCLAACLLVLLAATRAPAQPLRAVVAPLNPLGIEPAEARKVQRWITAATSGVVGLFTSPVSTIRPDGPGSASPAGSSEILIAEARPRSAPAGNEGMTGPPPGMTG
mgnify:CR=1 FL=1